MIDVHIRGQRLLEDWQIYKTAKPRTHVLDIQHEKDMLASLAVELQSSLLWETNSEYLERQCRRFEQMLTKFKDKIVLELLTNGTA